MALGLNKVLLIGNVGQDPDFRTTKDGKEFCNFSLATTETWRDRASGNKKERTEWHRIVVFSEGLVEIIRSFVMKGSKLYAEGSLQTRKFLDARSQEQHRTEVVLQGNSLLILLDNKKSGGNKILNTGKEDNFDKEHKSGIDSESIIDDKLPDFND